MSFIAWTLTTVLALLFLAVGLMKVVRSRQALAASGMDWVQEHRATYVRLVGALEVAGGLGLFLPPLLSVAPVLGPVAAGALAVVMVLAVRVHLERHEAPWPPVVVGALLIVTGVVQLVVFV